MAEKYATRIKTRTELKDKFITGSIPTEEDYHDLIDSLRHVQDESGLRYLTEIGIDQEGKGVISATTLNERLKQEEAKRIEAERRRLDAEAELRREKEKQDRVITSNKTKLEKDIQTAKLSVEQGIATNTNAINTIINKVKALFRSESNDYGNINLAFNRSFGNRQNTVAEGDKTMLPKRKLGHQEDLNTVTEMGVYDASNTEFKPNNVAGATARELIVFKFDERITVQMLYTDEGIFVRRFAGIWRPWEQLADYEKVMKNMGSFDGSSDLNGYRHQNGVYHIDTSTTYGMPQNWPFTRLDKETGAKLMVIKQAKNTEAKQIIFADSRIAMRKYHVTGGNWLWTAWTVFEPLSNMVLPPLPVARVVAMGRLHDQGNLEWGVGVSPGKTSQKNGKYTINLDKPLPNALYTVSIETPTVGLFGATQARPGMPYVFDKKPGSFKVLFSDTMSNPYNDTADTGTRQYTKMYFSFTVTAYDVESKAKVHE